MEYNIIEEEIIQFWNTTKLKEQLIELRKNNKKFEFLDGPPFANGSVHYGHLLVSTIKDTIARYMSMKGYNISYQIGFDCHGLPLEQEAEKIVGKVSPYDSHEKLKLFNDMCRNIIKGCSESWYEKLGRLGRQFNKDETYYTSNFEYMKSLWWAFGELVNDNLIYKSKKVMPYSPLCETPLSNFEASSNYVERTDLSVYVKFKIVDSNDNLLIFTTTPWSLFANQGICVNAMLEYLLINVNNDNMWIEKSCVEKLIKEDYNIIETKLGKELAGIKYVPIFPLDGDNRPYIVYADNYVTAEGTGLVHLAPLFGADDMRVMKNNNYNDSMIPSYLVDSMVRYNIDMIINDTNILGKFVMDASTDIAIHLKKLGYVYKSEKIKHSYPHCWRTDGPLIYMATDAWFLNVQKIIPELIENNKKIQWSPSYVGTERFANWIKDSPDWCISRNRVWGTPIPIWEADNGNFVCIKTVEDLEKLTGNKYNDIHLDSLNNITFKINGREYKRTFGVLDCWFESGMAGLSRFGYPDCIDKSYPVDFIAESIDQTRGWFYTLNVLSTALCHKPAFKKVIVSGLILAADGKKMSKRLQNYTNPDDIIQKYGADILRLYLIGSPSSKAEPFCFKDSDLAEIGRKLLPYYNGIMLLNDCMQLNNMVDIKKQSINNLDLWIKNKTIMTIYEIYTMMEKLEITAIPNTIYHYIDTLCNVFIKLSRDRLKMQTNVNDYNDAISTLYQVVSDFNILLAPFIPHLAEYFNMLMNKNASFASIHLKLISYEHVNMQYKNINTELINGFESVYELIETVRSLRQKINRPNYYPLEQVIHMTDNMDIIQYKDVICKELNIKNFIVLSTETCKKKYRPNKMEIGKVYKKEAAIYCHMIENSNIDSIDSRFYFVDILAEEIDNMIGTVFDYNNMKAVVYINTNTSTTNDTEAEINNIRRQINEIRKEMGLKMHNIVDIIFEKDINVYNINTIQQKVMGNIIIVNKIEQDCNTIETFNGKKYKVAIICK